MANAASKGGWPKPSAPKPLPRGPRRFPLAPRKRASFLNPYLPLVIGGAALALLAGLLCRPSWRKWSLPPWAAWTIGTCVVAGGVGYGIVTTLGQNPGVFPSPGRAGGGHPPPLGQKSSMSLLLGRARRGLPPPLPAGEKAPPIKARGWLNGPPPHLKDRNVRVMVVDIWGKW